MIEIFNHSIDSWLKELEHYSLEQLLAKPSPNAWSMGQLFIHLISTTDYFAKQAIVCAGNNEHSTEEASPAAKRMFQNNEFPDLIIEGPESNNRTPQPESKEEIISGLQLLKENVNKAITITETSHCTGKTKHPGLHYFNAFEWLQFAEMHLRHHFRQKQRLDSFLSTL